MKRFLTLCAACAATAVQAVTPLWMRDVRISPDGEQIVFCYQGDLYRVSSKGGEAYRLTTQPSYECNPVWSPDGKQIAFASDRHGSMDIYVMPAAGGAARRLTTHQAGETPWSFSPDGQFVYFSAAIQDPAESALFPKSSMTELYRVPVDGGRVQQVLATPAEMICFNSDGSKLYYQDRKGGECEWRKHHTSSITRDIWVMDTTTGKHTNLTHRAGEDRNPVLSPDGETIYLLSEPQGESMNVFALSARQPEKMNQVTRFTTHPVRFLSMGSNGVLCYTYDGEIYTQRLDGQPQKVAINLTTDNEPQTIHFVQSSGASQGTPSPDGKQVAFIYRGEVFVTSADYTTTLQVTHTAAAEKGLTWGADSRSLAYCSERNGISQLVVARMTRPEDPDFAHATRIEEEILLPSTTVERAVPQFSPNGNELAFIEDRIKLCVMNMKSKEVRTVTDGSTWYETNGEFHYRWSPDSQWFTLEVIDNRHDPYTDIALVSAQGGEVIPLTRSGYTCGGSRFVMDGNAILYTTERYGMRAHASWGSQDDVMLVFLNQDAYDKYCLSKEEYELRKEMKKESEKSAEKEKSRRSTGKGTNPTISKEDSDHKGIKQIIVEKENIEARTVRLTPVSSRLGDAILSADGETLYYLSAFEKGYDLWKMDLRKRETKLLQKLNAGWASLELDSKGEKLFLLSGKMAKRMDLKSEKMEEISYRAEMDLNLAEEREYMFNRVYLQEKKRFYREDMHGVDWEMMTEAYRKFLPHINNNYDFAELLSEWLGELNVSHTGGRYSPDLKAEPTANLGLLYDWSYSGNGMRIAEVVEKGPFDKAESQVKAGVIIERIDGTLITADIDCFPLLTRKVGRKTLVGLWDPSTDKRWEETVLPISSSAFNNLLYDRWVKQRAADVERWSDGRLGYVHIQSMGDDSFRTVYSDILGRYNHCEGIVIDTRFNGGGRLHEDIEVLFSGEKYLTQVIRGREACDMPSRRWNKPSIMIQCEANYSNAHGTPWVYKHKGIGKLVGAPVPGTMTSVSWERLQDPTLVFGIPIIGYRLPDGSYLENKQLEPDVPVLNNPETVVKGEDRQLRRAVEVLLSDIDNKK